MSGPERFGPTATSRSSATRIKVSGMAEQAKKRFGQNFLHDKNMVAKIVAIVDPRPGDALVEIGPGRGAMTTGLIAGAGHLTAIEIDRDLHQSLVQTFGDRLSLIAQDVLTVDFAALADEAGQSIRVVGNLPYNISSPILFHLLPVADRVVDQTFMLQKEVVDRMVAAEGSKTYGRLSVMLQARYDMERRLIVPPGAFTPAPKVDSAIVSMWPKPADRLQVLDWSCLSELVTAAFATRRKMIRNNLAVYMDRLNLAAVGLQDTVRAEDISVDQYIALANQLAV
jgi:16S rRNA (adenine1518-N6/adenine1519-N6)-dimethyltransferase